MEGTHRTAESLNFLIWAAFWAIFQSYGASKCSQVQASRGQDVVRSTHEKKHSDAAAPSFYSADTHLHVSAWQSTEHASWGGIIKGKKRQIAHVDRNALHTQRSTYSSSDTITQHRSLLFLRALLFWRTRAGNHSSLWTEGDAVNLGHM